MYEIICGSVFALAGGVAVATILNTIGDRLSRPAPREEVFHRDQPSWYYPEIEQ